MSSFYNKKCINCSDIFNKLNCVIVACDNCETILCLECGCEQHLNKNKLLKNHDPRCNIDTEETFIYNEIAYY